MIVYGDRSCERDPGALLSRALDGGRSRTDRLLAAGELAQGVLDHGFFARGNADDLDPAGARCLSLAIDIAKEPATARSSRAPAQAELARVLPERITVKTAEGFAYYALHPDLVAEAARSLDGDETVLGIRSIGATLAAVVAGTTGSARVATLRPQGDPFARRLATTERLARWIREGARFAIVDEGPGLSGSSFGAVADFLEDGGVPRDRITFLPSHEGDLGPHASPRHRARWPLARRLVSPFASFERRIASILSDVVGEVRTMEELSGGAWRHALDEDVRPPAWRAQERRKWRIVSERGEWFVKFVGLGEHGERAFARATLLARGGWSAPAIALREGLMVQPWIRGRALSARERGSAEGGTRLAHRERLLAHVARYLAFREGMREARGASARALRDMASFNLRSAGLARVADAVDGLGAELLAAIDASPAVAIDGRLQPWEWMFDGELLLKTDAVDHCAAHDVVGGQPIGWDVAGACVELEIDGAERRAFFELLAREGVRVGPELGLFEAAYLAFRIGAWTLAAQGEGDERERERIEREIGRLRGRAERWDAAGE